MSSQDSLYTLVHARFHEAFGKPHHVEGGGEQWTLRPTVAYTSAIHLLLNGTPDKPGVWIFDPHDSTNGVENTHIAEQRQIDHLVQGIEGRLQHANRAEKNDGSALSSKSHAS